MHYLAAKKVYEVILESPEGGKTMLGHTHPGAAKWKALLDGYRRRNLGWASAAGHFSTRCRSHLLFLGLSKSFQARFLVQNVGYELPALSKQAADCERQATSSPHCDASQNHASIILVIYNIHIIYISSLYCTIKEDLHKVAIDVYI